MSVIQFRSCCRDLFLDLAGYFDVVRCFCWVLWPWTWYWSLLFCYYHTLYMLTYIRLSWCFLRFFGVLCRSQLPEYPFHCYVYWFCVYQSLLIHLYSPEFFALCLFFTLNPNLNIRFFHKYFYDNLEYFINSLRRIYILLISVLLFFNLFFIVYFVRVLKELVLKSFRISFV